MNRVPLLRIGLLPFNREARLKAGQTGFEGCPRIIDRKKQHTVAEVLDGHLAALEAVVLGKPHGLTAA